MPAPVKYPLPKNTSSQGGRPHLLTKQREAVLLKAIEDAMPLKHAAMRAGISYDTLNRWRIKGESESAPSEFREFCKALRQAEAIAMQKLIVPIQDAAAKDWRAAAWMLERRFRDEFAKPQQIEHSGPGGNPIPTQATVEPEVLQRMRKQAGIVDLMGKLGAILMKKRQEREDREHDKSSAGKRPRLRE